MKRNKVEKMAGSNLSTQTRQTAQSIKITTSIFTHTGSAAGTHTSEQRRKCTKFAKKQPRRWRPLCDICPSTMRTINIHTNLSWLMLLLTVGTIQICHTADAHMPHAHNGGIFSTHFIPLPDFRPLRMARYSQPLHGADEWASSDDDSNSFRPIIPTDISPEYIAHNVFTKTGQYHVFEPVTSDLRATMTMNRAAEDTVNNIDTKNSNNNTNFESDISKTTIEKLTGRTKVAETNRPAYEGRRQDSAYEAAAESLVSLSNSNNGKTLDKTAEAVANKTSQSSMATHKSKALPNTFSSSQANAGGGKLQNGNKAPPSQIPDVSQNAVSNDIKELEALLVEYAESFFNKAQYEPSSELVNALQSNHSSTVDGLPLADGPYKERPTRHANASPLPQPHHHFHHHHHHQQLLHQQQHLHTSPVVLRKADGDVSVNIPRAMESGRLLFFSGLKKALWPIYMGLQVLKSLLFALFLPTLIGSVGKLLGKGIISGSAPLFIRPPDAPQDLDFRDNTINFDDEKFAAVDEGTKEDGYAYNQAEASQTHYTYNAGGEINRIEQQNKMPDTYLSALQTIGSASFKNSGSLSGSFSGGGLGGGGGLGAPLRTKPVAPANMDTFQKFQKVPASSLLLSNYDPFYSPLLSRLDSVFAQLKLNSDNENCREKLICLMYANPAKYAPYSNLVSAQLSRELNELRKPTSDNPDILRFFKYMRAAKDGQDGIDCEKSFDRCSEFKDFENPAMVSTYHDINKLVQARKLT
ncbi:uncharacterized protein LOC101463020 [Ceratitis capitata]|uniref:uncharacterized protein LOC101463020 n=1 Tax=Ceratitis capitata TaxID=7213 RepID=UPI0006188A0C|nr:uncharacterized protein LOC101463020 [Ceratitis capitata]XP_020716481.1 uncharacterized protein LOC101463020 [Ceratitis capitata]